MLVLASLVLLYIPVECVATYAVSRLLKAPIPVRQILLLSLLQGFVYAIVRDGLGLLGPHVIIVAVTYVLLGIFVTKKSVTTLLTMRGIILCLTIIGELIAVFFILPVIGVSVEQTMESTWLQILCGWFSAILLVGIALVYAIIPAKDRPARRL